MNRAERKAQERAKDKRRFVLTEELTHPLFYLGQERAFAPGIVKEWPKVFYMPRLCPHGRAVLATHAQVVEELRRIGYTVTPPIAVDGGSVKQPETAVPSKPASSSSSLSSSPLRL